MMDSLLTRHILLFTLLFTETSSKTIVVPEGITIPAVIGEELTLIVGCNITSENFEFRVQNRTNTNKTPLISTKTFGDFSDELGKYKLHVTPSYVAFTINKVEEMNLVKYRLQVEKRDGLCNSNVKVTSENHGTDPEAAQKGKSINHENHGTDPEAAQKGKSISHDNEDSRTAENKIMPAVLMLILAVLAGIGVAYFCYKKRRQRDPRHLIYPFSNDIMLSSAAKENAQEETSAEKSQLQLICNRV